MMKKLFLVLIAAVVCATAIVHGGGSQPRGGGALPYKVFVALVSQSGTDAPTMVILQNTLGGTPVWHYVHSGAYTLYLVGAFPENKTTIFPGNPFTPNFFGDTTNWMFFGSRASDDQLVFESARSSGSPGVAADIDDALQNTPLEIRVYP